MMKMYGMNDDSMFRISAALVLNVKHPLVKYVFENPEGENTDLICRQLYDLAMLGNRPLTPEEMTAFMTRSNEILLKLAR